MNFNTILTYEVFNNSGKNWLLAFAILISSWFLLIFLKKLITKRIIKFSSNINNANFNNFINKISKDTKFFIIFIVSLYFASKYINLEEKIDIFISRITFILVLFQLGLWTIDLFNFFIDKTFTKEQNQVNTTKTQTFLIKLASKIILWATIFLLILDNIGINITALIGGLGIGGIAIALAVQNILGDLFASLSIILDKPFEVGDFIIIDDFLGTVENIGLKTTRIKSLGGEQVIFSNSDLLKSRIRNYKRMQERRVVFKFRVVYQTKLELLEKIPSIIKSIITSIANTRFDRAHFQAYGDFSLNFEVVYWVINPDFNKYMDIQEIINLKMYKIFKEHEIDFAYPTSLVYLKNN